MEEIYGINNVLSAINCNRVKTVIISDKFSNSKVLNLVKDKNIEIKIESKEFFDKKFIKVNHQNIMALIKSYKIYDLSEIIKDSINKKDYVLCILDELQDPHNLGAILRSADIFNIDAIVYKKVNQVSLSSLVGKISSGAINYVKCVEVVNLNNAIKTLKENGFWIFGLDGNAKEDISIIYKNEKVGLVFGNEGKGISRLVKENCDFLVKIKQYGHISCLNVSNACAITFYELRRK